MNNHEFGIRFTSTGGQQLAGDAKAGAAAFDQLSASARNFQAESKRFSEAQSVSERQIRQTESAVRNLSDSHHQASASIQTLRNSVLQVAAAFSMWKLYEHIKDVTLLSARYETLGISMYTAGRNVGYTRNEMDQYQRALERTGISMQESRNSLISMASANMDLSKSTQLARAAQDLAVVGNINSSEAFARLIQGIKSGEVEILKTLGLNVSFEKSYQSMADQLGKNTSALSEHEKLQARTNATLQGAVAYSGIYEEAMGSAGKQLSSLKRYHEDLATTIGSTFNAPLAIGVSAYTKELKGLSSEARTLSESGALKEWGRDTALVLAVVGDSARMVTNTIVVLGASAMQMVSVAAMFADVIAGQGSGSYERHEARLRSLRETQSEAMMGMADNLKLYHGVQSAFDESDKKSNEDQIRRASEKSEAAAKAAKDAKNAAAGQASDAINAENKKELNRYEQMSLAAREHIAVLSAQEKATDKLTESEKKLIALDAEVVKSTDAIVLAKRAEVRADVETAAKLERSARDKAAQEKALADQQRKEAEAFNSIWQSVDRTAHDTFVSILDGGQDVFTRLRNTLKNTLYDLLYQMTVRKWVFDITASVAGTAASGAASAAGSAGMAALTAGAGYTFSEGAAYYAGGGSVSGAFAGSTSAGLGAMAAAVAPYAAAAAGAYVIAKYGFGWGNSRENVGGQYLVGQASRDGFTGRNAQNWTQDGGWFGGTKTGTEFSAVSDAQLKAIKSTTDGLQRTFDSLGSAIGDLGVKTRAWSVDLTREGDLNQMLADGMANALIPALKTFQREGENLAQTAQRLTDTFSATTALISAAGLTAQESFGAIGIASTDARNKLIEAAGGLNNFSALSSQYISNILGQSGQYDAALASVGRTFAELNVGLPTTREEFAKLYNEQLKLGNTGNVTRLMAVSAAFNTVISSAEQAGAAARASAVTQYQAAVSARDAVVAAAASVRAIQSGLSASATGNTVSLAMLTETARLAGAGDKSAQGQLGQMAQEYISAAKVGASSALDVHRAVAMVQSILTQTGNALDASASSATAQLDAASKGNDYLAAISGSTQNTANNITALSTALAALPGAIAAANEATAASNSTPAASITGAYTKAQSDLSAEATVNRRINDSISPVNALESQILKTISGISDVTGMDGWQAAPIFVAKIRAVESYRSALMSTSGDVAAAKNRLSVDQYKQLTSDTSASISDQVFTVKGLPAFAVGSNYITHDGPAIVHKGEEITPRPYVDLQRAARDETNALLSRLVQSSSEIKAEVEKLKASQHADAMVLLASTDKTADLLNNVSAGGGPLEVTVVSA